MQTAKRRFGLFLLIVLLALMAGALVMGLHYAITLLTLPESLAMPWHLRLLCYVSGVIASGFCMCNAGLWFLIVQTLYEMKDLPATTDTEKFRERFIHYLQ